LVISANINAGALLPPNYRIIELQIPDKLGISVLPPICDYRGLKRYKRPPPVFESYIEDNTVKGYIGRGGGVGVLQASGAIMIIT